MREIKFRLRIGNEVIGYERWHKGDGSDAHWEHLKIGETVWRPAFLYATDRDLYSGLLDRNGKEIWEGDIVKVYRLDSFRDYIDKVYFVDGGFFTEWYHPLDEKYKAIPIYAWPVEVIGNLYENPELLKEEVEAKHES